MTDNILVGGLPNVAEMLRQRERQDMDKAIDRAKKTALIAYPVIGESGAFAVPSQSELGQVYIVRINLFNGMPLTCGCRNLRPYCTHWGAAHLFWTAAREYDDERRQKDAEQYIFDTQKEQHHA